jgi:acetoin utilization deacetylase AcuC-like enzyme
LKNTKISDSLFRSFRFCNRIAKPQELSLAHEEEYIHNLEQRMNNSKSGARYLDVDTAFVKCSFMAILAGVGTVLEGN